MAVAYRYRGVDRQGVGHLGSVVTADLPAWVEDCYRRGWRTLLVAEPGTHEIAGQIITYPSSRQRTWWAARTPGQETP